MQLRRSCLLWLGVLTAAIRAQNDLASLVQQLGLADEEYRDLSDLHSATPFDTDFPTTPSPWNISIERKFIDITRLKVALTRYHEDIDILPWTEGPPRSNISDLRDYWIEKYDWYSVERQINSKYKQFVTTVTLPDSNYTDPVPLHFVHHRSKHENAIPLLFMHGTPGSFLEVGALLDPLTDPPQGQPAFHVVAPSMPGYGFSPAPKILGMDPTHAASAMNELMKQLGYFKYVIQAGDWGGIVLRYTAGLHPDNVVSALANFFIVAPNATDLARFEANQTTPDETAYIKSIQNYGNNNSGYRLLMSEFPLQAVISMTDSPLGNLAFEWTMMKWLSTKDWIWTLEDIITWSMMYWIPGPYASMRHYREMALHGVHAGVTLGNVYPYINVPIGISEWPGDFWYRLPLEWAQRYANTTFRVVHDVGAHFPAVQNTDLLVADIRSFFGNASLSNTGRWLK
ncbi:MAG: hypothetical protein LQ351_006566 [Letrouitia transgressa]|nr:MAG: hypothetical protein LQ351_006566 [Letrouitia transgressa]